MSFSDSFKAFKQRFKLTSHHTMERSGAFFGVIALTGALILGSSAYAASQNGKDEFADRAVWTNAATTSKTDQSVEVQGVYTNKDTTRAMVLMSFDEDAQISYDADDYAAFLLGSDESGGTSPVKTPGVNGRLEVFGSTGYMAVILESDAPFEQQVLNLTVRGTEELADVEPGDANAETSADELAESDETFAKYDQWRFYVNPGANGATQLKALESRSFDPAEVFYETILKDQETETKQKLDAQLVAMKTNLRQIQAYTDDMATTKVDGLFIRPPEVPSYIDGDKITGDTAKEAADGKSTLKLETDTVADGGFDINWQAGNIYDGYLTGLVPEGQSYVSYLSEKTDETSEDEDAVGVSDLEWKLSDGSDLARDHSSSDTTMRPLTTVMNNLSQSYQNYAENKSKYQTSLMLDLLRLEVDLRDVQSNSSLSTDEDFLVTYSK